MVEDVEEARIAETARAIPQLGSRSKLCTNFVRFGDSSVIVARHLVFEAHQTMPADQENLAKTLTMLSGMRAKWKSALLGLPLFIGFTLFYFYGMNMLTYPWAYKLTPTTPQGQWIGTLALRGNESFLVHIEMGHDTVFSDTQSNTVPDLSGKISICRPGGAVTSAPISGNPKWTGSSVVLGTKIDFGNNTVPEKLSCQAEKNALNCVVDFERPISRASKKMREDFKNVYTPKAEFSAKIPVAFVPVRKGAVPFADQCKQPGAR